MLIFFSFVQIYHAKFSLHFIVFIYESSTIEKLKNHSIILSLAQHEFHWIKTALNGRITRATGPSLNHFRFSWDARQDWKSPPVFSFFLGLKYSAGWYFWLLLFGMLWCVEKTDDGTEKEWISVMQIAEWREQCSYQDRVRRDSSDMRIDSKPIGKLKMCNFLLDFIERLLPRLLKLFSHF